MNITRRPFPRVDKPTVARLHLCPNHDYLTFVDECSCLTLGNHVIKYAVIGTQYGYIHTTAGDIRLWRSYSGAYKAGKKYVPL